MTATAYGPLGAEVLELFIEKYGCEPGPGELARFTKALDDGPYPGLRAQLRREERLAKRTGQRLELRTGDPLDGGADVELLGDEVALLPAVFAKGATAVADQIAQLLAELPDMSDAVRARLEALLARLRGSDRRGLPSGPGEAEKSARPLRKMMDAAVRDLLGREPLGIEERSRIERQIRKSHPGLATALLEEEDVTGREEQ